MSDEQACTVCNGTGVSDALPGYARCYACDGRKTFPAFGPEDARKLGESLRGKKGFRRSPPNWSKKLEEQDTRISEDRAYYVWRMTRFHGGADVTLPVMAQHRIHGDPMRAILDHVAECLAKRFFGTDLAGSARWGSALEGKDAPEGLPESAYSGGRVYDGYDPFTNAILASDEARMDAEREWEIGRQHAYRAEIEAGVKQLELFVDEENV